MTKVIKLFNVTKITDGHWKEKKNSTKIVACGNILEKHSMSLISVNPRVHPNLG
jgi:hypothetical protein